MIPSGAFQSPTSLDGVVPEFEQFALALNINSSLSIEAKKIMRNFDSGGGLTVSTIHTYYSQGCFILFVPKSDYTF